MFASVARRQLGSRLAQSARRQARWTSTSSSNASSAAGTASPKAGSSVGMLSAATTLAIASYTIGSLYPPELATYITPRTAPPPPDPNSSEGIAKTAELEDKLLNLPNLLEHRAQSDTREWYETRPYMHLPEERKANSLTAGALRGPGKLAVIPLVRAKRDESEAIIFTHFGRGLCGHEGLIHGGLLATVLDESLGRIAILNLPDKVGVTAYLHLNYRNLTRADQFVVIKTKLVEKTGRKAKVQGRVEDLEGNLLADAEALFVQPRFAKLIDASKIRQALGQPADSKEPLTEGTGAPLPIPPLPKANA